jgi:hypothetical protein
VQGNGVNQPVLPQLIVLARDNLVLVLSESMRMHDAVALILVSVPTRDYFEMGVFMSHYDDGDQEITDCQSDSLA